MSNPSPTTASLAAIAMIKSAAICPFKFALNFEIATSAMLAEFSKISVEKNSIIKFLLFKIPTSPMQNKTPDKIK